MGTCYGVYKYNKKNGEHIDILDNKVSGLKRPLYDAIALRSNIGQIPDEIQKENWTLYRYYLADSILLNGRKLMLSVLEKLILHFPESVNTVAIFILIKKITLLPK